MRQVLIGAAAVSTWMTVMLILGLRHRSGQGHSLERISRWIEAHTDLPGWTLLPYALMVSAFLVAGVGFVWDVALHLDAGRDPGPFANPSHFLLIIGLVLVVTAGWLAVVMPKGREVGSSGVRISRDWYVPAGGLAMLACSSLSLTGFAADDVWHRLFGQDVTLWGPSHLMMITGGLLTFLAGFVLMREGMRTRRDMRSPEERRAVVAAGTTKNPFAAILTALLMGGVLTGMTIAYQQEFSYGFPQFRLMFHPVLIAFSAGVVLTAARALYGRGGALLACAGALVLNAALSAAVRHGFGELLLHYPLYIADAVLVEIAAAIALKKGRYWFAGLAALLVGTLGTLAEHAWSHTWMPIPWPAHMLPGAVVLSVLAAGCGAVLGSFFGTTMAAREDSPLLDRRAAWAPFGAIIAFAVMVTVLLPASAPPGLTGTVQLTEVAGSQQRLVAATVTYSDPHFGENADWVQGFAWQGDDIASTSPMKRLAPGVWTTTKPLPADGTWKVMLRVHKGGMMGAVPVYMPADAALNLPAVPALPEFTRPVTMDRVLLQRERKDNVPGYLFALGSVLVALMTILLVCFLGWALLRVARDGPLPAGTVTAAPAERRPVVGEAT